MLFSYKTIDHDVSNLHKFLKHTVKEVWCKKTGSFQIDWLHKDFKPIVEHIGKNEKDYLKKPIENIYNICQTLNKRQKMFIEKAFDTNNNINRLCGGRLKPVFYKDIDNISVSLASELKTFCSNLYEHVISKGKFCSEFKSLDEYYKEFVSINTKGKCPFCGLTDIKSRLLTKRDAFDHYFPKGSFPFNSVNLKNLAPSCNTCNSSYKLEKIPTYDSKMRGRKAFYPFDKKSHKFDIKIKINSLDPITPHNNDLDIAIISKTCQQEVNTWNDLFGINQRYIDKCSSDDSKYWLQQLVDEAANYNVSVRQAFNNQISSRKITPLADYNFLRIPFLEACKDAKII